MTKKDFKKYMKQGLGRCILVLKSSDNIEKYKEIVLWGCLHNLSYDTQCEGTRASYIYELTTYFNDEDYFLKPCIEAFKKTTHKAGWLFCHYAELLSKFAENGNERAIIALKEKYEYLLNILINKRKFKLYDVEREDFERICITLYSIYGTDILLKLVTDMGMLFEKNPHYTGSDFDWFCSTIDECVGEKKLHNLIKRESKKSQYIATFYQNYLNVKEEINNIVQRNPIEVPSSEDIINEVNTDGKIKHSSRVIFSRRSNESERQKLAQKIIEEQNLDKKAEMLFVFALGEKPFPLSHEIIIEYSKSQHERLREVAFAALTKCQSECVREYALQLLTENKYESQEYKSQVIEMLLINYKPADKTQLLSELNSINVNYYDESYWHSIGFQILYSFKQGRRLPKEFLLYVYNTTLCSCCRYSAVRELAKHRWLTPDIINECRYDSNCDISAYINRYYSY